jgi:hypothetical protein
MFLFSIRSFFSCSYLLLLVHLICSEPLSQQTEYSSLHKSYRSLSINHYSPFTEYSSLHKSYRSLSITIIPLLQSIQHCARVIFLSFFKQSQYDHYFPELCVHPSSEVCTVVYSFIYENQRHRSTWNWYSRCSRFRKESICTSYCKRKHDHQHWLINWL